MTEKKLLDEVDQVMRSVIARSRNFLEGEYQVSVTEMDGGAGDLESLTLLDLTAIIGMGGRFNLLVAFSFQDGLVNAIFERMTHDLDVQPEEVDMYREAAVGEVVNTILGHCTIDLQQMDQQGISMTPPIILDRAKTIRRMKNSMFYTQGMNTVFGRMNISLVGPRELFETNLDYVK